MGCDIVGEVAVGNGFIIFFLRRHYRGYCSSYYYFWGWGSVLCHILFTFNCYTFSPLFFKTRPSGGDTYCLQTVVAASHFSSTAAILLFMGLVRLLLLVLSCKILLSLRHELRFSDAVC